MYKNRLKLALQNVIVFGGLFVSMYFASQFTLITTLYALLALFVAVLGSVSVVYKKKEVYHMVYTEEADEEDKKEGDVYSTPRPNYFKGGVNYFLYGVGAVYASVIVTNFDFTTKMLLMFLTALILLIFTRYNFEKHSPIMIFEDMTIQFILFTGLSLIVKSSTSGVLDLLNIVVATVGVLLFISMLLYRYHTITHYKHKKQAKFPKNTNILVLAYGLVLSALLISIGVSMTSLLALIFLGVTILLILAVLLLFRSDTLPSVKDIL